MVFELLPADTSARPEPAAWSEAVVCAGAVEDELARESAPGAVPVPLDPGLFDPSADGAGAEAVTAGLEALRVGSVTATAEEAGFVPGTAKEAVAGGSPALAGVPAPAGTTALVTLAVPLVTGAGAAGTGVVEALPESGELVGAVEGPAGDAWVAPGVSVESPPTAGIGGVTVVDPSTLESGAAAPRTACGRSGSALRGEELPNVETGGGLPVTVADTG